MALEACLQLSTIRACSWNSHKEKISLPLPRSSSKGPVSSLSSQQSSLFSSFFNSQQKYRRRIRLVCDAKNAVDGVTAVDEAGWDNAVSGTGSSSSLVLVEFWAPWCGPCRMIEPVIGELAKDYAGKLACYKVNTDTSPTIATKYGIRSIPTLLFFKDGEKKESVIGAVPKSTLCETIDKYLELS